MTSDLSKISMILKNYIILAKQTCGRGFQDLFSTSLALVRTPELGLFRKQQTELLFVKVFRQNEIVFSGSARFNTSDSTLQVQWAVDKSQQS